jgi:hypothetical protein
MLQGKSVRQGRVLRPGKRYVRESPGQEVDKQLLKCLITNGGWLYGFVELNCLILDGVSSRMTAFRVPACVCACVVRSV